MANQPEMYTASSTVNTGYISSEDEWVSDDESSIDIPTVSTTSNGTRMNLDGSIGAVGDSWKSLNCQQLHRMPLNIQMIDSPVVNGIHHVFRDENKDSNKIGLRFSEHILSSSSFHLGLYLYHKGTENVHVPLPALYGQTTLSPLVDSGIIVFPSSLVGGIIEFSKKKSKHGKNLGIEIGSTFQSFVPKGTSAQFKFVAIPMQGKQYMINQAESTPPFFIKSKRQPQYLPSSAKRAKKSNNNTLKLKSDNKHADTTIRRIKEQLANMQCKVDLVEKHLKNVAQVANTFPTSPLTVGLTFAYTRCTIVQEQDEDLY